MKRSPPKLRQIFDCFMYYLRDNPDAVYDELVQLTTYTMMCTPLQVSVSITKYADLGFERPKTMAELRS